MTLLTRYLLRRKQRRDLAIQRALDRAFIDSLLRASIKLPLRQNNQILPPSGRQE